MVLTGCESIKTAKSSQLPAVRNTSNAGSSESNSAPPASQNNANLTPEEAGKMVIERRAVLNDWLKEADEIAKRTKDPVAAKIVQLIRDGAVIGRPNPKGVQFLEAPKSDSTPWMTVVPVMPNDDRTGKWENMVSYDYAAAQYLPDARAIVINPNIPTSPLFKGFILLHEGNHMGIDLFTPYDQSDHQLFCEDERNTHEFQNKLMSEIGGKAYQDILEQEINRLKSVNAQNGGTVGRNIPQRTLYHDSLDKVFGPALSEHEKDLRETHLWIHAYFTLIDRELPGGYEAKEDSKAKFLFTLYSRKGMFDNKNG